MPTTQIHTGVEGERLGEGRAAIGMGEEERERVF